MALTIPPTLNWAGALLAAIACDRPSCGNRAPTFDGCTFGKGVDNSGRFKLVGSGAWVSTANGSPSIMLWSLGPGILGILLTL